LHLALFGAYDGRGMDLHGVSNSYGRRAIDQYTLKEYSSPARLNLDWIGGAEAAMDIFSFEVQRNFSHLYFSRFTGTLMLRNQIYDSKGRQNVPGIEVHDLHLMQSLALRLRLRTTFFPLVKNPALFEPYVFGAWNISNTITGNVSPWYIFAGYNFSLNIPL
jgi:hypothetical protein